MGPRPGIQRAISPTHLPRCRPNPSRRLSGRVIRTPKTAAGQPPVVQPRVPSPLRQLHNRSPVFLRWLRVGSPYLCRRWSSCAFECKAAMASKMVVGYGLCVMNCPTGISLDIKQNRRYCLCGEDSSMGKLHSTNNNPVLKTVGRQTARLLTALYDRSQSTFTLADAEKITGLNSSL